jgi:hypothetical protein
MPDLGLFGDAKFRAVCSAPSVEKTPMGSATPPIPYPVTQDLSNLAEPATSVRINGKPVYVLNQSYQPACVGDQAGVADGVKSGTTMDRIEPIKGSMTVSAEKKAVIRLNDPCYMVSKNTVGRFLGVPSPGGAVAPGGAISGTNPPASPPTLQESAFQKTLPDQMDASKHPAQQVPGLGAVPNLSSPQGLSGGLGQMAAAVSAPPGTPAGPGAHVSNHLPAEALPLSPEKGSSNG